MAIEIKRTPAPAVKPSGRGSKALQEAIEAAGKFTAADEWFVWPGVPKSWKPSAKKLEKACPHVEVYADLAGNVIVKAKSGASVGVGGGAGALVVPPALSTLSGAASSGVTVTEGKILKVLYGTGRKLSVGDIKAAMSLTNTPTAAIAELRRKGLVNTDDSGEKTWVTLTAKGNDAAKLVR